MGAFREDVVIYGAGEYGALISGLCKEQGFNVRFFIDDDLRKVGTEYFGKLVFSSSEAPLNEIELIIVAIRPLLLTNDDRLRIMRGLRRFKGVIKFSTDFSELLSNDLSVKESLSDFADRLLWEESTKLTEEILHFYSTKCVLVLGCGGSIGSELVKQLDGVAREVIGLDKNEESIFWLGSNSNVRLYLGDASDYSTQERVFSENKIDVVINAAAYKHVPLLEDNFQVGWYNNLKIVENASLLANKFGVKFFLQVSTDKAVNPTSVMGASKRAGELLLLNQSIGSLFKVVITRFGNVLGSSGSVLHVFDRTFKAQEKIEVTHEDITRYFMTIKQAVTLLIQSVYESRLNSEPEIFVLDMGVPKRIIDLAADFLIWKGVSPELGNNIVISGLRPGEKLYEELFLDNEVAEKLDYLLKVSIDSSIIKNLDWKSYIRKDISKELIFKVISNE